VDVGLVKGANERDKVGLPRLMEALESNMWSTMRRHPSAAKKEKEEKEKKRDSQVLPVGSDKGEGQEQEQGEGVEPGKQQQQQQGEEKSTNTASPIATATVNVRAIPAAAPKSSPAPETAAAAAGPSCSEAPPAAPPLPPSAGTGSMDSPAIARSVKSMEEASTRTRQSSEADSSASSGTKVKRTEDLFNGELPDLESNVEVDQYSQLFSKVPLA
jgi:hypothetical protein